MPRSASALLALLTLTSLAGCVRRELHITSDPSGALVFLNNVEVGRTPVTRPFTFYGTYDVVVRKEGYETLKTRKPVVAPWWQWVPIDLVAEMFPLTDKQRLAFTLTPIPTGPVDPAALLQRADQLRTQLPAIPTTPTTPTTGPATQPTPTP
jgi:hypothetical protein